MSATQVGQREVLAAHGDRPMEACFHGTTTAKRWCAPWAATPKALPCPCAAAVIQLQEAGHACLFGAL